ncbi:MAG: alanine--tRNA ligase [Peptococcaceae bacterium]|nr:alanine--tRNA ligase [Peptococcaceae bacterium]
MLTGNEIRNKFIDYFVRHGHTHVKSSSLVPYNDPTLLFTNAGMNQFKNVFLGLETRDYKRATTVQKCVRAGGKHNDLETVGKTARHHTFFEMLGNFSFGQYFKEDAIKFCWDFLTNELKLPKDRLYITIYEDDDEAYNIWHEVTGFDESRIYRLGKKDNFWQMGDVGPCGPCSEVHYDRGEDHACDNPAGCKLGVCDCDRWLEIWNLVFMQYNRDETGKLTPLPHPNIDTGMGLERITSILQGVETNFDTDLFVPLLEYVEELTGKPYYHDERGFAFRVIADHARACTFLIADGVLPSNEGRGYVLRRILRRAVRLGKSVGLNEPFLYKFTAKVTALMGEAYPELVEHQSYIESIIRKEEERFYQTLQDGLKIVHETVEAIKAKDGTVIDGKSAFKFYDTYGFPIDLTKDIADEEGMTVDIEGFEAAMAEQRRKAKEAQNVTDVWDLAHRVTDAYPDMPATEFVGYDDAHTKAKVLGLMIDKEPAEFGYDTHGMVILDKTPFYAQGGGQVGEQGKLMGKNGVFNVENTLKLADGKYIHQGYLDGRFDVGDEIEAFVDTDKRLASARNHTATHLLHYALRKVLGDKVHQAGSLVDASHLRFDFSSLEAPTADELAQIERTVNEEIMTAAPVNIYETTIDDAKESGHVALFGEKYGDKVRCVDAGLHSKELCGGMHVDNVGAIGSFKILSESSVSAGVRRIEAITGLAAYEKNNEQYALVDSICKKLKVNGPDAIIDKIAGLDAQIKALQKQLDTIKMEQMKNAAANAGDAVCDVKGLQVACQEVQAANMDELRKQADLFRNKLEDGVVLLAAVNGDQVQLVCMLTAGEARKHLHAGNLIKEFAPLVGGKGGGRPDMAQAGGKNPAALKDALAAFADIVERQYKE